MNSVNCQELYKDGDKDAIFFEIKEIGKARIKPIIPSKILIFITPIEESLWIELIQTK